MDRTQGSINQNIFVIKKTEVCSYKKYERILIMVFFYISFVLANLFDVLLIGNTAGNMFQKYIGYESDVVNLLIFAFGYAFFNWALYELVIAIYTFFIKAGIYTFMIPKLDLKFTARKWLTYANLAIAVSNMLFFVFPMAINFSDIFYLLFTTLAVIFFFFEIKKKHLNDLTAPFALKTFALPLLIYQSLVVLIALVRVVVGGVL